MIPLYKTYMHVPYSKPRASGDDPLPHEHVNRLQTVNPARAGMIPVASEATAMQMRKPRASGDDPGSPETDTFTTV